MKDEKEFEQIRKKAGKQISIASLFGKYGKEEKI